jgi:asparagine synthase (glutamine-hydrolysing)
MSGFFGVFSPGGNVGWSTFDQMQQAIKVDGYDVLETHVEDRIAMGHLMLRIAPESVHDRQPLKSLCGRYLLVGHFRLDYRDELADKLGLTQRELDETPDSVLVIMSYQKWSEKCVHHLEGDWAFVLYDRVKNTVLCCKDKFGTSALFYALHEGQFIFSYSTQLFENLYSFPLKIDFNQMFRLSYAGLGFEKEKTLVKGIYRLAGGTILHIDSLLKQIQSSYFDFHFPTKIVYKYELDYLLDFRSKLMLAVLTRLRSIKEIGIFQSSGLDSNSISYFAANELAYRNRNLFSYTSCNAYLSQYDNRIHRYISDDILLKEQLKHFFNVHPNFDDFKNVDFESLFKEVSEDFYQPLVTKNSFWIKGIFHNSKHDNVGLLLNGQLGNFTISWNSSNFLATQLFSFKLKYVFSQLIKIVRVSKNSFLKVVWLQIGKPIFWYLTNSIFYLFKIYPVTKGGTIFKDKNLININWGKEVKSSQYKIGLTNILNSNKLRFSLLRANANV